MVVMSVLVRQCSLVLRVAKAEAVDEFIQSGWEITILKSHYPVVVSFAFEEIVGHRHAHCVSSKCLPPRRTYLYFLPNKVLTVSGDSVDNG